MDSDNDIRSIIRNIINKVFSPTKIPDEMRQVLIGKSEMEIICNLIFPDINTNQNNIINQDVKIDLEIFEGLGLDKDNSIFSNINCRYFAASQIFCSIADFLQHCRFFAESIYTVLYPT